MGEIERPAIQLNGIYYAVKNNAIASWVPCKVVEFVESGNLAVKNVKYYRIKFLKAQSTTLKTVPSKYLAYCDPPTVRLPIGKCSMSYILYVWVFYCHVFRYPCDCLLRCHIIGPGTGKNQCSKCFLSWYYS